MPQPQVAFIGIDSLDYDLVQRWSNEGLLPTFRRLFARSRWGMVENPRGFEAGTVWPTFATGVTPEVHGQYDGPYKFDSDAYELRLMRLDERAVAPMWARAGAAGKRVAVVDVPYVLLESDINGVHVVDWLTHVRTNPPGLATAPPEVAETIAARHGLNPFFGANRCPTNDVPVGRADEISDLRDKLLGRIAAKEAFCIELWAQERWDLFMAVFHDAHDIGHMCWHIHDAGHERHDPALAAIVGDPVRDIYVALDGALGRLVERLGGDTTVIVYSSHGMGRERTATRFLDDMLAKLDAAYQAERPAAKAPPRPTGWVDRLAPLYRALVPAALRRRLVSSGAVRHAYRSARVSELQGRLFFEQTANHATGGVRFNLKGRERAGRVAPGPELAALRARLARDLQAIVNADTGEPIVDEVMITRDLYDGPLSDRLPDMLLEWNKRAPIERVTSPLFGTLESRYVRRRSGDHTSKLGFFCALGAGIAQGHVDPVKVVDFAPTFAALLGYADPQTIGAPISGLVPNRAATAA